MSLLQRSRKDQQEPGSARPSFNWIEVLAIPIASSIMETQPIIMILLLLGPILMNMQSTRVPVSEIELTLMLLSMQWWARLVQHFVERGMEVARARLWQLAGLGTALLLFILFSVFTADNLPLAIVIVVGVLLWAWKRGIDRTRRELNEEQLIFAFRIGFIIVIALLIFTSILPGAIFALPGDVLAQALPLFFLSGLLALSFSRLLQIQQDNALHPTGKRDTTRSWALILSGIWGVVVVVALLLETFSFALIQGVLLPIWYFLLALVLWVLELIVFLLSTIFDFFFHPQALQTTLPPGSQPDPTRTGPHGPEKFAPPPQVLVILGELLLVALVIGVIALFVYFTLGRLRRPVEDEAEDEEREGLDIGAILQERREERQRRRQSQEKFVMEQLDPQSVRARYRELLLALQQDDAGLARQPAETTREYQRRLLLALKTAPISTMGQAEGDTRDEAMLLEELTRAYARERYGAQSIAEPERHAFGQWVPRLIQSLHRPRPVAQPQVEDRWGNL